MSDYNGRIGQIVRAFEKNEHDPAEVRYVIRKVLRDEHHDGWTEGYSDGSEDTWAGEKAKREAEQAAAEYEWSGINVRGESLNGSMIVTPDGLEAVIRDRYDRGWRELHVTLGGGQAGGIAADPAKPGELMWWTGDHDG